MIAVPVSSPRARRVGLGRAPVVSGSAQVRMNLKGSKEATIVSDFTKPLPVKVTPTYELDGKPTTAGALRGKSGTVKVTLKLANVTAQQTTVSFMGFNDVPQKMTVTAPQPILASLSLVLPGNASDVSAPGASLSPSRTGISVGWTPLLFGPAGTTQSFSYQMTTKRASIPVTSLYVWTLGPYQTPTGRATKASAQAVAAAQAQASKSLAAIQASLTKLSQLQASLVAKATKSQNANSRARTSSDTATLNALEQKLHGASGKLANAEAEADAGIAEINAVASSVSIKGLVQARAAADLARASAKLATLTANLERARVPTSAGTRTACAGRRPGRRGRLPPLRCQGPPRVCAAPLGRSCPAEPSHIFCRRFVPSSSYRFRPRAIHTREVAGSIPAAPIHTPHGEPTPLNHAVQCVRGVRARAAGGLPIGPPAERPLSGWQGDRVTDQPGPSGTLLDLETRAPMMVVEESWTRSCDPGGDDE